MKIGRYEILDIIGEGAMGTVYRAHDPLIERTVAIKAVATADLRKAGAEFESSFLREAQSAGRLSHPCIVTIYDVGETEAHAYIAMEHLPGTTLRALMDKGPMPFDLVLDTAIQMAEALAFAHEHGVIHRDIKPANVIISGARGRIKLTDFGIAHLSNREQARSGMMLGSPRYMSPEQAMGRQIDGSSDIFSLGSLLYEMVTGKCAFGGDSLPAILYRVINEMPLAPKPRDPDLPPAFVDLLTRMLQKDPAARPDARSLIVELKQIADVGEPAAKPSDAGRIPRMLPVVAFATPAVVLLLSAIGIIVISFFVDHGRPAAMQPVASEAAMPPSDGARSQTGAPEEREIETAGPIPAAPPAATPRRDLVVKTDPYLEGLARKRTELELQRTELLLRYTEQHPDVVLVDRQLEQLAAERSEYLRTGRH